MNRSRRKSPSRKGSASPARSPGRPKKRPVSKSPVRRSLRDRSRSRTRVNVQNPAPAAVAVEKVKRTTRQKSPLVLQKEYATRTFVTKSAVMRESAERLMHNSKSDHFPKKSPSVDTDEVIRNSISRFDEVVSEASSFVTVRSRRSQESDLRAEIDKEVRTLLHGNNVPTEGESPPKFFGGWLGALLLIFTIPAIVVSLQLLCTKGQCRLETFSYPTTWKSYFDLESTLWYIGFLVWQLIATMVPIGSYVQGFPENDMPLNCRCNGLANLVLTMSCVVGAWYSGLFEVGFLLERTMQILISSIVFAFLFSLVLYFKAGSKVSERNGFGNTGNFIYDFWIGRQINPRVGPVDLKLFCIRSSLILAVIINIFFVMAECEGKKVDSQFSTPLLVLSTLQTAYLLDFFVFEKDYLTSFTVQHEGLGYMLVMSSAVFPFFITFIPKCIYYNMPDDQYYISPLIAVVNCIGYIIFRVSNYQKASFRKDFHSSQFSSIDSLVCIDGRRLLVGGMWGRLKHPNHLGCLIIYWSWSLAAFSISSHRPLFIFIVPVLMSLILLHRCLRDSEHCKYRYGSSWDRYSSRIKYHMLPKVF